MFEKKKIHDWIINLELGLDKASGKLRGSNGVYSQKYLPFKIAKIEQKQNIGETIDLGERIIFDYTISLFGKENEDEYHIKAEKELIAGSNGEKIIRVDLSLDSVGLKDEISILKDKGYKVKLYSDGKNRNIKHLVAIKKDELINEIEKPFIQINTDYY